MKAKVIIAQATAETAEALYGPVSYTHLDVYKRQTHIHTLTDSVIKKHGMHRLTDIVISTEGERQVAHATTDVCTG